MHKLFLSTALSIISICCMAQTSQKVLYYYDHFLKEEVQKEKASYSKTITQTADTITTEVKYIKTNAIEWSTSYKGDEPVGIWISGGQKIDYNFTIIYSADSCAEKISGIAIDNYFKDMNSKGYIAPKIKNGQTIYSFIGSRVIYPESAKLKGLKGTSTIFFTINAEGLIENIRARKGANIAFDKEAIRIIKLISFSSPATLNGKPQSICVKQRITFTLSE